MENMSQSEASSSIDHNLSTSELSFDFEKHSESLTCDYEDLDSWLLRKSSCISTGKSSRGRTGGNSSRPSRTKCV